MGFNQFPIDRFAKQPVDVLVARSDAPRTFGIAWIASTAARRWATVEGTCQDKAENTHKRKSNKNQSLYTLCDSCSRGRRAVAISSGARTIGGSSFSRKLIT
jgi:hypothetical protein